MSYSELLKHEILSQEEEIKLIMLSKTGGKTAIMARNRLIVHNMRFIAFVCRRYSNKYVHEEDLYSDGIEGFMYAIEKFDPEKYKDVRLSAFSFLPIHRYIQMSDLFDKCCIKIPYSVRQEHYKMREFLESNPDIEFYDIDQLSKIVAEKMDISVKMATYLLTNFDNVDKVSSLDRKIMFDENGENDDYIPSEYQVLGFNENGGFDNNEEEFSYKDAVSEMLDILDDLERELVETRFDIIPYQPLRKIGERTGLSHQRLSQIYNKAMEKLRNYAESNGGSEQYLEELF